MPRFPFGNLKCFCPVILFAALAAVGCGSSAGTVTGKVAYNGATVKGGTVSFMDAENKGYSSPIAEDGTYKIEKVPLGPVKVTVETKSVEAASKVRAPQPPPGQQLPPGYGGADPEAAKRRFVPIPEKYQDLKTSDLTYTVTAGSQTYDPPLK